VASGQMKHDNTCPSDYVSDGVYGTSLTLLEGGYVRIGKLVLVNARCQLNKESGNSGTLYGFPPPILKSANYVAITGYDGTNEKAVFAYLNSNGSITVPAAYPHNTGILLLHAMYIAR